MSIPPAYTNGNSSLFDPLRNSLHQPPTIIDLGFNSSGSIGERKDRNLRMIYSDVVSGGRTAELFLGGPYRAGDESLAGVGSLEGSSHGVVHVWTGSEDNGAMDMGSLLSAGRDPIFFAHHANVDRMWEIWRGLPGAAGEKSFNDSDWLDASFLFWDENLQLVQVKVRDCLDTVRLGYTYEAVPIQWVNTPPRAEEVEGPGLEAAEFPLKLDSPVSVVVRRNEALRKGEEEEVVVVDGIELDGGVYVRFDVYVSAVPAAAHDSSAKAAGVAAMSAGRFVHVPTGRQPGSGGMMITRLKLGLTAVLLEGLGAAGDGSIVVTLVPRSEGGTVKVGDIRIGYSI